MEDIRFTKKALTQVEIGSKPIKVSHPNIKGFHALLQPTKRTYYLYKRQQGGKPVRVKIGNVLTLAVAEAERLAIHYTNQLDQGINPNEEKRKEREERARKEKDSKAFILGTCYERFIGEATLKETTRGDYQSLYKVHLKKWEAMDIRSIDADMCEELHKTARFPDRVCKAIILLGTIYDYHAIRNESYFNHGWDLIYKKLRKRIGDQWYNQPTKEQPIIPKTQVGMYVAYREAMALHGISKAQRPYFAAMLLAMLTGMRFGECEKLEWDKVDFDSKLISLYMTKVANRPHKVFMSNYTEAFLRRWKASQVPSTYVFPLFSDPNRHIKKRFDLSKRLAKGLDLEGYGTHTNRRTFTCVCEQLGISEHRIQNLINHSVKGNNVTRRSYLKLMKYDPQTAGSDFGRVGDHLYKVVQRFRKYGVDLSSNQRTYFLKQLGPNWESILKEQGLVLNLEPPEFEKLEDALQNIAEDLALLGGSERVALMERLDPRLLDTLREQIKRQHKFSLVAS